MSSVSKAFLLVHPVGRRKWALVGWGLLGGALFARTAGGPTWLAVMLAISAATIFLARVTYALLLSELQRRSSVAQTPKWMPQPRFEPRLPAGEPRGYVGYTESFSAEGTLQAMLEALPTEPVRVSRLGFAIGYLQARMNADNAPVLAGLSDFGEEQDPADALGWLQELHRRYADNAPPDSRVVLTALNQRAEGYRQGRSLTLAVQERELGLQLLLDRAVSTAERQRRLEEQRRLSDIAPDQARSRLDAAIAQGARFGRSHRELAAAR